jgi:hypothetical protein
MAPERLVQNPIPVPVLLLIPLVQPLTLNLKATVQIRVRMNQPSLELNPIRKATLQMQARPLSQAPMQALEILVLLSRRQKPCPVSI